MFSEESFRNKTRCSEEAETNIGSMIDVWRRLVRWRPALETCAWAASRPNGGRQTVFGTLDTFQPVFKLPCNSPTLAEKPYYDEDGCALVPIEGFRIFGSNLRREARVGISGKHPHTLTAAFLSHVMNWTTARAPSMCRAPPWTCRISGSLSS